jgi:ribosomal protein L11 methyltransferase
MHLEVVFEAEEERVGDLSDALLAAGALAATIEDAESGSDAEVPLYGEPGSDPAAAWPVCRIVALFEADCDIAALVDALHAAIGASAWRVIERRDVAPADWVRMTQAQFEPQAVGRRLWIVPSWHEAPAERAGDAIVLRLDPGLAFGTGSHATTRLCLRWLESHLTGGESVLDFGCGSGILAIAAAKLGAGSVLGTDIDRQAISASIANARDNHCSVEFVEASSLNSPPAEIVIANILSNPLKLLAPLLAQLTAPGGQLVLSGILERQSDELIAAYRPWMPLSVWQVDDGWVCLSGRRPGRAS